MRIWAVVRMQNLTLVNTQVACAYIELEAMKAENQQRLHQGQSVAYGEAEFVALIDKYQLTRNLVLGNINLKADGK